MLGLSSEQDIGGVTMNVDIKAEIERLFDQFNVEPNENLIIMLTYMVDQQVMEAKQVLVDDFIKRLEGLS